MPTYEYLREDGSVFEVMQKFSDKPLETCPETGQSVRRLITGGSGVIYKGDGWYVTDYKKSGNTVHKSDSESSESTGTTDSKPAENGKSETKPAKAESAKSES